ncbi:MAG: hypothetical protein ACTHNS_15690 [Marmoricola sp.]
MGDLGTDISWPQCPGGLPMPLAAARFVVVGLTDGPAFSPNHCLSRQAAWVHRNRRHVATYAVVSYPNRRELARFGAHGPFARHRLAGRLRNVGYQQAVTNLRRMHGAGLHSPVLWIDLEQSSSHPWRGRAALNAAVVRGLVNGYRSRGQRVGFYSTASTWHEIVGGLRFGAPEWRTAGPDSPRAALGRCHERDASIQGGPAVLAQWWNDRRDHDLVCPGFRDAATLQRYFEGPRTPNAPAPHATGSNATGSNATGPSAAEWSAPGPSTAGATGAPATAVPSTPGAPTGADPLPPLTPSTLGSLSDPGTLDGVSSLSTLSDLSDLSSLGTLPSGGAAAPRQ